MISGQSEAIHRSAEIKKKGRYDLSNKNIATTYIPIQHPHHTNTALFSINED